MSGSANTLTEYWSVLPPEIQRLVDQDARFREVCRSDGAWIDPYTGAAVPVNGDLRRLIITSLATSRNWNGHSPLTPASIRWHRWRRDLKAMLSSDPRLTLFSPAGIWLNPWTGKMEETVVRSGPCIDEKLVDAMAWVLASSPETEIGQLLDLQHLAAAMQGVARRMTHDRQTRDPAMERDLTQAGHIQRRLLGPAPEIKGYEIGLHYAPHAGVSGDFYDFLPVAGERFLVLFGDVAGHGMQAGLIVASALKSARYLSRTLHEPIAFVEEFNDDMKRELAPGQFMTLSVMLLDPKDHTLNVVLAGHHHALFADPSQDIMLRKIGKPGMAVGITSGSAFRNSLQGEEIVLSPHAMLLQYSDAAVEAHDGGGNQFGLTELAARFLRSTDDHPSRLVDRLACIVSRHAGGHLEDDCTLLAIRRSVAKEAVTDRHERRK